MIAERITFGEHDQSEFGLLPYEIEIGVPEAKTYLVSVPARNGDIDLTEYIADGEVFYENREIVMSMYCFADVSEYPELEQKCKNALHGKRMKISFDADPEHYFLGRLSVEWQSEPNIDVATITANCDPYKYKNDVTTKSFNVSGSKSIILENARMPAVPTVTTDAEITVKFKENTIVFGAGTRKSPDLALMYGSNSMELSGNGNITFSYQEGDL